MNSKQPFKWKHYQGEIILLCVRWYLKYAFSVIVAVLIDIFAFYQYQERTSESHLLRFLEQSAL